MICNSISTFSVIVVYCKDLLSVRLSVPDTIVKLYHFKQGAENPAFDNNVKYTVDIRWTYSGPSLASLLGTL